MINYFRNSNSTLDSTCQNTTMNKCKSPLTYAHLSKEMYDTLIKLLLNKGKLNGLTKKERDIILKKLLKMGLVSHIGGSVAQINPEIFSTLLDWHESNWKLLQRTLMLVANKVKMAEQDRCMELHRVEKDLKDLSFRPNDHFEIEEL